MDEWFEKWLADFRAAERAKEERRASTKARKTGEPMNPTHAKKTPRAVVGAVALAIALALPGSTLAATSSGTTPESLDIAATISMTVPVSVTYTQGKGLNQATVTLTGLDTDNPNGLTVKLDVNQAGSGKINPASRSLANGPAVAGWTGPGTLASPFPNGGSSEQVDVAFYGSNNPSVHAFAFVSKVDASTWMPGTYTGSLHFTATTNP